MADDNMGQRCRRDMKSPELGEPRKPSKGAKQAVSCTFQSGNEFTLSHG
ncbi:hypothetical protein CFT9_03724 [Pseudomonas sp. CFT9]|jgi:hypothetical protein|nr:hypothetical protein CFT9_03724 [Pseudomonas sp. CFT9]